jgi:4-diphosphocytidyl-2-C-methyl-D-erythritol kinase
LAGARSLSELAQAKVNLYLHVVGRRADGYHLLDSLVVFPAVGDVLRASPADTLSLTLGGPFAGALVGEANNLVMRAARLLAARACPKRAGARLELEKHLPVASGLGGGSADAAATLRVLCRLWDVSPELWDLALSLGADVPACLASRPARMAGVGECIGAAPILPPCGLVLVNPGISLPTSEVFRAYRGGFSPPAALPTAWPDLGAMTCDLAALNNDLETPAVALCPTIAEVLAALRAARGCRLARMSGSGATCFGLFANSNMARELARAVARRGWWSWAGALTPSADPQLRNNGRVMTSSPNTG